jgi:hypothetical protein
MAKSSRRVRGAELGKQHEKLLGSKTQLAIKYAAEGKWDKVAFAMKRHLIIDPGNSGRRACL